MTKTAAINLYIFFYDFMGDIKIDQFLLNLTSA